MARVVFNKKDSYQKKDCFFCKRDATLQADIQKGKRSSSIRCCDGEKCKRKASKLARDFIGQ